MNSTLTHGRAIALMVCAASLWSIAGVLTRQLESARSFEVTFWRSVFAALFVAGALLWQRKRAALVTLRAVGMSGIFSGAMWAVMFCCFMIALTMTTVANTLIVMSVAPLLTALLAALFLKQAIALRTWLAILAALAGMVWMFAGEFEHASGKQMLGMAVAFAVPVASAINVIILKKSGQHIDLIPTVFIGGVLSALLMAPLVMQFKASAHDLLILATLGFFQLGFPCMLMVAASKRLSAPEISLLALIEVVLGPVWAWLGAGEIPALSTLYGGSVVLCALIFNEFAAMRARN